MKALAQRLNEMFPYAGILAQDSVCMRVSISRGGVNAAEDSVFTKRGFVARVHNGRALCEYSFNYLSEETLSEIVSRVKELAAGAEGCDPVPDDEPLTEEYRAEYETDPDETGVRKIVEKLSSIREKTMAANSLVADAMTSCSWQKSREIFVSKNRCLKQANIWFNAAIVALGSKDGNMIDYYRPFSGVCGAELLDRITDADCEEAARICAELTTAGQIEPGEYDCICDPETTGMIVHEAFGHGVEMDMFVKDRALAGQYEGKYVASELVTMRDGACAAKECGSFLFDDEGTRAQNTLVIDRGVLVGGYADAVSAKRLGISPTGNGRRESFERKAYTRMTNTFFEGGSDTFEEMLASVKYGFLLENPSSGMEDPKNWGIQCMVNIAREIKDGAFTGRVFSPIVLTGYVPDLLKSITMMSNDVYLGGSGFCGKGYKEWVKVSDGGPYIKARVRLG